jgi:hypothetical protein
MLRLIAHSEAELETFKNWLDCERAKELENQVAHLSSTPLKTSVGLQSESLESKGGQHGDVMRIMERVVKEGASKDVGKGQEDGMGKLKKASSESLASLLGQTKALSRVTTNGSVDSEHVTGFARELIAADQSTSSQAQLQQHSRLPQTEGRQILNFLRSTHVSNQFCGGCGVSGPDWVAVTKEDHGEITHDDLQHHQKLQKVGLLVCVTCSGIYRGLPDFLVRSFAFDVAVFQVRVDSFL